MYIEIYREIHSNKSRGKEWIRNNKKEANQLLLLSSEDKIYKYMHNNYKRGKKNNTRESSVSVKAILHLSPVTIFSAYIGKVA